MALRWLERRLTLCALHYCLRLTEKDFYKELRRLEIPFDKYPTFKKEKWATTHYFKYKDKRIAIVCLDKEDFLEYTGTQIAALLVHEAVHIWQRHAEEIGSYNDHGSEEEAYAIQSISQSLMEDFREQIYGQFNSNSS